MQDVSRPYGTLLPIQLYRNIHIGSSYSSVTQITAKTTRPMLSKSIKIVKLCFPYHTDDKLLTSDQEACLAILHPDASLCRTYRQISDFT